ncbi:MAG: DUF3307 domain-containing protein [Gemmatimonadetes bacterium]|nr:DUF3307 domain-containing protein [Gemmatimonadota bacterium]
MTAEAAWLLAFLLIGHFLADFTRLSTASMLRSKAVGTPPGPIGAHAGVHSGLVAVAVALVAGPGLGLVALAAAVELVSHFAIDVGRGRIMRRFPPLGDPANSSFWSVLGLDQLAHALVLVGLVLLVT